MLVVWTALSSRRRLDGARFVLSGEGLGLRVIVLVGYRWAVRHTGGAMPAFVGGLFAGRCCAGMCVSSPDMHTPVGVCGKGIEALVERF